MNRRPKVLFIIHDLYQDDNHFPLGPAYLSGILRNNGIDVEVYCQDVFHYTNDELAVFLDNNDFDMIGIGFLASRFIETIVPLCEMVGLHKKNAWLILGGPGPSPVHDYILKKTKADIIVIGEAEETITELVRCKENRGDLAKVKGIAYVQDGRPVLNERRKPIKNLDLIPFPEWSLFPMDKYTSCLKPFRADSKDIVLGMISSRGCINRCNFCYRMEDGIRVRSVENVIKEIDFLKRNYGVNYFTMLDELFIFSKKRLYEFRDALKDKGLEIKFSCNARVDLFDEELAVALKDCGCQFLNFGMESSDQTVLDLMKKRTTVGQNIRAAEIAGRIGIGLGLNFLWGNIGDTEESLRSNVELIKKYNTYDQLRTVRPVTPYPGCDLYYEAIKKKYISGAEDFFTLFKNSDLVTVNFTDIPEDKFYNLLFDANKELITDHYMHTSKDMARAESMINDFRELYFGDNSSFRGARHYIK